MPKITQTKGTSVLAKENGTAEQALTSCKTSEHSAFRMSQFSKNKLRAKWTAERALTGS